MQSDNTNVYIVISAGIIASVTIAGVVLVCVFRPGDNSQMVINLIGFATLAITSLISIMKSAQAHVAAAQTSQAVQGLNEQVNGRLSLLIDTTRQNATLLENQRHVDKDAITQAATDKEKLAETQHQVPPDVKM
jgi:hypothetical protein